MSGRVSEGVQYRFGRRAGAALLVAAAMQFAGTFTTLYHRLGESGHSLRLYDGLPYSGAAWFVGIGALTFLGWVAYDRPTNVSSAAIVGFCAPAFGSLAYAMAILLGLQGSPSVGTGFYLIMVSHALEITCV